MNNFLNYLLAVFAIYRCSIMIAEQEGPFDIFTKFRMFFINRFKQLWIHTGVSCAECVSFWLSLPIVFAPHGYTVGRSILLWLGTSGIVALLIRSSKE